MSTIGRPPMLRPGRASVQRPRTLPQQAATADEQILGSEFHALTGLHCRVHDGLCLRGAPAVAWHRDVGFDTMLGLDHPLRARAFRHEIAHLVQIHNGWRRCRVDPVARLELEAMAFEEAATARLGRVRGCAAPARAYGLVWLLALGAAAYVLLRPGVANAPSPDSRLVPSVSEGQVAAEAFALFFAPGAAYSIAGRLALGWMTRSALAGAVATTGYRGTEDLFRGQFSGVGAYAFDAITGAIIGIVAEGGLLLVRERVCVGLDWLATHGMRQADLAITRRLALRAAQGPITAREAQQIMSDPTWHGRMATRWLERRGQLVLYRGQGAPTREILSPISREQSVAASQTMESRMRQAGLTPEEIAGYMARWHNTPVPGALAPPGLAGEALGGAGIPLTRIPGVASAFGEGGVVYVVRLPAGSAIRVPQWGLALENEFAVLHRLPPETIIDVVPATRIPALTLDEMGRLVRPTR